MTDDVRLRRGLRVDVHPQWLEAVAAWERFLRAAGRSPGTVWLRTYHVLRAAESLPPPWTVTLGDLVAVLDRTEWSAETRKSARSSLRSFFGWAVDDGRIDANPAAKLPPIAVPAGRPKPIPDDVLEVALAKADESGRLMIMLAAWAGLRRAEIAAVHSRRRDRRASAGGRQGRQDAAGPDPSPSARRTRGSRRLRLPWPFRWPPERQQRRSAMPAAARRRLRRTQRTAPLRHKGLRLEQGHIRRTAAARPLQARDHDAVHTVQAVARIVCRRACLGVLFEGVVARV